MDQLEQLDHYEVLGVSRSASADELKRAYRQQMARYHPDRFAGASPAEQAEAGRRAQRINEAYRVLSDFAARAAYNRSLAPDARGGAARPAAPPPPAAHRDHLAELYEQAQAHLGAGRSLQAAATLREIQAINPFYRDSAALLEQAEAGLGRRRAAPRARPDEGRRTLLVGGIGGLLLAGAGIAAWALRRPGAIAGALPTAAPAAGGAITAAPAEVAPTAAPGAAPTAAPPTAAPPTAAPPTAAPTTPPTVAPTVAPTEPPPTATAAPPTAPPPSATPAALAEEGRLLYAEEFTRGTGWPALAGNGWSVGFAEGAYQIVAGQGAGNIWAFSTSPGGTDYQIGVDVELSGGVGGLMLRYSDGSYLAFLADPAAGAYRLEEWGGGSSVIAAEAHPAVAAGPGAVNRLFARMEGDLLSLRVNGVPVLEIALGSPAPTNRYGMIARATAGQVVALFRSLAIRDL